MAASKTILIAVLFLSVLKGISQETKTVRRFLSPSLVEKYEVLKADRHIKNGQSTVTDLSNNVFALGQYKNGKKDSIWNYANEAGIVIQKYNYTDSVMVFNNSGNSTLIQSDYKIDDTEAGTGGTVSPPCQIGGVNYGFYMFYNPKNIPPHVQNQTSVVKMSYHFAIDTTGKLEKASVSYSGAGVNYEENIDIKNLSQDALAFLPARVGNTAVRSSLTYSVDLNVYKSRTQRQYTTPTQDSKMSQGIYH